MWVTSKRFLLLLQLQSLPLPFGVIRLLRINFYRLFVIGAIPFPMFFVADDGQDALGMLRRGKRSALVNQMATATTIWTPEMKGYLILGLYFLSLDLFICSIHLFNLFNGKTFSLSLRIEPEVAMMKDGFEAVI